MRDFKLSGTFLEHYEGTQPDWGPLGYVTYKRTYSRKKPDGTTEEFWETCARVVEGVYSAQKRHCRELKLPWNNEKAQRSAQEMFSRMWEFKWLPPGRGLWMMGTDFVDEKGASCLNNCGFVSTKFLKEDFAEPFCWMMDMLMLGVGVGFDTRGAGRFRVQEPRRGDDDHVVEDSREGWVQLLRRVLTAYAGRGSLPRHIDYSNVRPSGSPIKGFGGTASGPGPLDELIHFSMEVLDALVGKEITAEAIVDLANLVGRCVVAGNVRRSAEIAFGDPHDQTFLSLKNPDVAGDKLKHHRWACVAGDTLVDTCQGLRPIASLCNTSTDDLHASVGGVLHPVLGVKMTGHKPVFSVEVQGGQPVVATANHQFLVQLSRNKTEWRRVDQLSVGDRILSPVGSAIDVDANSVEYARGYLLGALIGDGTFTSTTTTDSPIARVQTYVKDSGEAGIRDFATQAFALFSGRSDFSGFSGPHGDSYYFASLKSFTEYAASLGVQRGSKTLTEEVLASSVNLQAGVVAGLFDADGWVIKDRKTVAIESSDTEMINNLQLLLARLGVVSRVNTVRSQQVREFPGGYKRVCNPIKRLVVSGYAMALRFMNTVQPKHTTKCATWDSLEAPRRTVNRYTFKVNAVVPVGAADVYDMCVPGVSSFSANGLHVHNSNNSILADVGMDYEKAAKLTALNGEPGYLWLENAQDYGRMGRDPDYKDRRALGGNPCLEQTLEDRELCCLVETFPSRHDSLEDYLKTLKYAYLYAKSVTLISTHNERTNAVMMRNRRIGCSMSGIVQAIQKHGRRDFFNICDEGYNYLEELDDIYSEWLCVPRSVKKTSVKPSGTVSLLPGVTPGIHFPHSEYYLRRIRFQEDHPLVSALESCGFIAEKDKYSPSTVVVSFAIKEELFDRSKSTVSMWEQLENAAQMQQYWADNQVSVTVTFNKKEAPQIKHALELYETRLKGVSFLPLSDHGYEQAPYEEITKEEYERLSAEQDVSMLPDLLQLTADMHDTDEKFCDGDACVVQLD